MRLALFALLALVFAASLAPAQSILDNMPAAGSEGQTDPDTPAPPAKEPAVAPASSSDTYTVTDVNADVRADTAAHARDQALMQAERAAFSQLETRLGVPDTSSKMSDDAVAGFVQSFEVQSEHLSAVRYIGVFTIRFKPTTVQKKFGKAGMPVDSSALVDNGTKPAPSGPVAHLTVAVQTDSLAAWGQIKRRMSAAPPIVQLTTLDLGRGVSHVDLSYGGSISDLQQALTMQGLILRQSATGWEVYDGSMVPR